MTDQAPGVVIDKVMPKSPAEQAGIKSGDRIERVAGEEIFDMPHLMTVIGRYVAGDEIEVELLRGKELIHVKVKLEAFAKARHDETREFKNRSASAGLEYAMHFSQSNRNVRQIAQAESDGHSVNTLIGEGQAHGVGF